MLIKLNCIVIRNVHTAQHSSKVHVEKEIASSIIRVWDSNVSVFHHG